MRAEANSLPLWAAPPGWTVLDLMAARAMPSDNLARLIGIPDGELEDLLNGNLELSPAIAVGLEKAFGASASFWIRREANYRERMTEFANTSAIEEKSGVAWLKSMPIKQMVELGWIRDTADNATKFRKCLEFFGVPNLKIWHETYGDHKNTAAFRTSTAHFENAPSTIAWLRRGELLADGICCKQWNPSLFSSLLQTVRELTRIPSPSEFIPRLQQLCASAGVAVVVAKAPKGCRASGATFFSTPSKAVLLLSARYLSDDQFWFSFFHEAGHLILHAGIDEPIIEVSSEMVPERESEANTFAFNLLIPTDLQSRMEEASRSLRGIVRLARDAGVSNGIVVGQLQHYGLLSQARFNNLKARYQWN